MWKTKTLRLRALALPLLITCNSEPSREVAKPESVPERQGTEAQEVLRQDFPQIVVRQAVRAGEAILPLHMRRKSRSAQELVQRAERLAQFFAADQPRLSQSWAEAAIGRPNRTQTKGKFVGNPELLVDYAPHTDLLAVGRRSTVSPQAEHLPRSTTADARSVASSILAQLQEQNLANKGDYGVVSAGNNVVAAKGARALFTTHMFDLVQFVDGVPVWDSILEIELDHATQPIRIAIAQVDIAKKPVQIAARGSAEVTREFVRWMTADLQRRFPDFVFRHQPGRPEYRLDPLLDEATIAPRMVFPWNMHKPGGAVSRMNISALGFMATDVVVPLAPPRLPVECRNFAPKRWITPGPGAADINVSIGAGFTDWLTANADILHTCIQPRLFEDAGVRKLLGVMDGDLLSVLGLRSYDHSFTVCQRDASKATFGQCKALESTRDVGTTFQAFFPSNAIVVRFVRSDKPMRLQLRFVG